MKSYRCYYLMKGQEPSPLSQFIVIQAADAVSAAQQAMNVTGCVGVTEVIRVQG
ncbi:hypothetical protein M0D68_14400 [Paraburkholderia sp. SEWSISQ10-3 4]|uniref:hypothetical protein n=1 Tax=Paraburkholderia TaxID=1822464 RepID=UPI002258A256|nr:MULTISPECIES: hypothetical protein [Paraburkholderia]MCX4139382.1 hypothetical protein [Paraburkholderia aspalathi]MDN7172070.1 hypothetical protein [Paraburkholderia sp. SEWSISQ10-3 4]MDQ6501709.1 hypothetical protein [Paraburkholderia aspalathi]